jgi:hypothetical protein
MTSSTTSALFSGLSIEDADVPKSRVPLADNPFAEALKASAANRKPTTAGKWEGQGKQVKIPATAAPDAERMIRQAAEALGIGSAVRLRTPDGKVVDVVSVGAVEKPAKTPGGK